MLDTRSGGLLRRFRILPPVSTLNWGTPDPNVVDDQTHRLISAVQCRSGSCSLNSTNPTAIAIDTRTGRSVHVTRKGVDLNSLVLDGPSARAYGIEPMGDQVRVLNPRTASLVGAVGFGPKGTRATYFTGNLAVDPVTRRLFLYVNRTYFAPGSRKETVHVAVLAIDTRRDRVVRRVTVPREPKGTPGGPLLADPETGRVFLLDAPQLIILDAQSGRIVQRIRLAATVLDNGYDGVAVDVVNHRYLIYGGGGVDALSDN